MGFKFDFHEAFDKINKEKLPVLIETLKTEVEAEGRSAHDCYIEFTTHAVMVMNDVLQDYHKALMAYLGGQKESR